MVCSFFSFIYFFFFFFFVFCFLFFSQFDIYLFFLKKKKGLWKDLGNFFKVHFLEARKIPVIIFFIIFFFFFFNSYSLLN